MSFNKSLKVFVIFFIIFAWIFSGLFQIWKNPSIPPDIKQAKAAPTVIFLTNTSLTDWTVPSDWNSSDNTIEVIGAGGGGANGNVAQPGVGGGGGASGAYAIETNISLTPSSTVTIAIGTGGGIETTGGDTYFNGASCALSDACGKGGGGASGQSAGTAQAGSVGTPVYAGADGGSGGPVAGKAGGGGGGGGGAGGMYAAGNAGGSSIDVTGGAGGQGDGTYGGAGGSSSGGNGSNGTEWQSSPDYGSGGGGGGGDGGPNKGNGTNGGTSGTYGAGGAGGGGAGGFTGLPGSGTAGTQGLIVITYESLVLTVSTTGTQTFDMTIPSSDNYVGGAFTFVSSGSQTVSEIIISDTGTVNANSNISNLKIRYETAGTCTYDGNETYFNETGVSFNSSEKATATGTMLVGTSQVCVYVVLDVGSGASADETLLIQITDPSTEVTVSTGVVTPGTAVAISGTTILQSLTLTVDNVQLNSQSAIDLIENTTKSVSATADISHPTACNLITNVLAKIYRSGVANDKDCTPDNNNCYSVASCSETSCVGTDAVYTCTIDMQFHADPTDESAEYWRSWIEATDGVLTDSNYSPVDAPDVNTLSALNIDLSAIDYETVIPDEVSSQKIIEVQTTGNAAIDVKLSGIDMTWSGNTILVGQQKYSSGSDFDWEIEGVALDGTPTCHELSTIKPTESPTNATENVYWKLKVPTGKPAGGPYTGSNAFEAASESACP